MRPRGTVTRGTTNPNRLRRLDQWLDRVHGHRLRARPDPLVVDLGYGATPVTTVEWHRRLRRAHPGVRVVGLEIDPVRVAAAEPFTTAGLDFALGGFELAGLRPVLVRAANVLRQYPESEVPASWNLLRAKLSDGGLVVDTTCDELGRIATWICLDATGPTTLTLAAALPHLDTPATLAERLPKALIHHNVPGQPVNTLITALDTAWRDAPRVFGPRDRWRRALDTLADAGWPIAEPPAHRRDGTLTVDWHLVAPIGGETALPAASTPVGSRGIMERRGGDMVDPVRVNDSVVVPETELEWRFSRSSGPGGQGVNTTDSRVELTLDLTATTALSDFLRDRALTRLADRLVDGRITVTASEHRSQLRNREAAAARLAQLLREAIAAPPKKRRPTKPSKGAKQRRLNEKKRRGQIKKLRRGED